MIIGVVFAGLVFLNLSHVLYVNRKASWLVTAADLLGIGCLTLGCFFFVFRQKRRAKSTDRRRSDVDRSD